MKSMKQLILTLFLVCATVTSVNGENVQNKTSPKIQFVNFKTCVENSKVGKQEQASFDALKKQMETSLSEKEKVLAEMANKLEDPDYLDSLSAEAETDLKRKARGMSQELTQLQTQYYQALQQSNLKSVQKLHEAVTQASNAYAKQNNIDMIINEESGFYFDPAYDISLKVVALMDETFAKESLNSQQKQ